ncbi:hypothetical protein MLD38_016777 [Melastoma candidum]|uniref:Uncharacterized protein n=1 Tax=Melastoma candidum TaxID=119954 RepID=A0ACB9QMV3_9MYRT|nr:hypothetical protein MLD38_016777 [Melastoma candidum]
MKELDRKGKSDAELPFFNLSSLVDAMDNFSIYGRLGAGGSGVVSKLSDKEMKNEAILIAKLKHRNLIRMLGFCLEDNEKILTCEYLPNKSLDTFLFDESKKYVLDWRLRFNIITVVAQGTYVPAS